MKSPFIPVAALAGAVLAGEPEPRLEITMEKPAGPVARWDAKVPPIVGAQAEYRLLTSPNLSVWTPASGSINATQTGPVESPLNADDGSTHRFFRLQRNISFGEAADPGAERNGFSSLYAAELKELGEITTDQFAQLYPPPAGYLDQITFDPTMGEFWDDWNSDPAVHNANPVNPEPRSWDFRLNERELATFKKLGFVVSERLATWSFGDMLYRIYNDDLPVFISSDAILQAWHRSYVSMLQEMEETYFYNEWLAVLDRMTERLPELYNAHGNSPLGPSILDADYFLTVALSLGRGTNAPSKLGQDARVSHTMDQVNTSGVVEFELFGTCRRLDFSQFKPRGHYTESEQLSRYFQMVMWLGRIEFRITPGKADIACNANDPAREFASSALLYFLLRDSGGFNSWSQMNAVINAFVGEPDSMNFAQLGELLKAAEIDEPGELGDSAPFTQLNAMLLAGDFGVQEIMSDTYDRPNGKLPRTFTVFGQRFVPDSWALGKVVFDNITWQGEKVWRFLPLSLDVAFGALGNNATVPQVIAQIQDSSGHAARDGFPYQHNLAAVRRTIDAQPAGFWQANIYNHWLGTLRTLSEPTTDAKFPQAMRTRAWGMKTVNTQLASWTHLRHDTVLYAKQSYSGMIICSYPKAYVEPVPNFCARIELMASAAADLIEGLELDHRQIAYRRVPPGEYYGTEVFYDSMDVQSKQVSFLRQFSARMAMLEDVARRQLEHQPLTEEQIQDLRDIVEVEKRYEGRRFTGWYPGLFYRNCFFSPGSIAFHHDQGVDRADFVVTDVHTAPPPPAPGYVLHQAVGKVNFLLIAVDCGEERPVIYGGPVLSHYELPTEGLNRMTDPEWAQIVHRYPAPVPTPWTEEFLVLQ